MQRQSEQELIDEAYENLPQKIRIGYMTWAIEVSESADSSVNKEFGHMNQLSQKIRLRPDQTPQSLANTFIHECLHAIHWVYGLWRGDPDEEQFANQTANGLCALFQDNPEFETWFLKYNRLSD